MSINIGVCLLLASSSWHAYSAEESEHTCVTQGTCRVEDELALLTLSTEVRVRGKRHQVADLTSSSHDESQHLAQKVDLVHQHTPSREDLREDSSRDESKIAKPARTPAPEHHFNQGPDFRKRDRLKMEDYVDDNAVVANIELSVPSGPVYVLVVVMVVVGIFLAFLLNQQRLLQGGAADKLDSIDTNFLYNVCVAFGSSGEIIKVGKDKLDADDVSDDGSDCPRAEIVSEDEPECEVEALVDALEPDCEARMDLP